MVVASTVLPSALGWAQGRSIDGQVLTRDGVAAAVVRVAAIPAPPPDARPEDGSQYYTMPPPVRSVLTGADGRYRMPNIPAGRYHVIAGILGQATYSPSTLDYRKAAVVVVGASGTATADIRLATPYGGRVRGRVQPPAAPGEIAVLSGVSLEELLEAPVAADGTFEFGHVPRGAFLISIFPTPPGTPSLPFVVGDEDVTSLSIARQRLSAVRGRVVVAGGGKLPPAILALTTATSHVSLPLAPDGTFAARVHDARHVFDVGGLPVGYDVDSIRWQGRDVARGLDVKGADVDGVVVTLRLR